MLRQAGIKLLGVVDAVRRGLHTDAQVLQHSADMIGHD